MTSRAGRVGLWVRRVALEPLVVFGVAMGVALLGQRLHPLPIFHGGWWIVRLVLGFLLGKSSSLLALGAFNAFRAHRTTLVPWGEPRVLITSGVFRRSRNPLYVSLLLLCCVLAVLVDEAWFLVGGAVFFLLLAAFVVPPEERALAQRFGDEWRAYAAQVRRWL